MSFSLARCLAAFVLSGAAACGTSPAASGSDGGTFVAFGPDFQSFSDWPAHVIENGPMGGLSHVAGRRTVFINHLPAAGATEFPVGTIIVKRTEMDGKIFARAKRGGTYNAKGAAGWEWFELTETPDHVAVIRWRGVGPPLGETYGGDPNAGCNMCHKLAVANDYVLDQALMVAGAPGDAAAEAGADAEADAETDGGGSIDSNPGADAGVEAATDDATPD
jgi:hypothetical protein